MTSFQPSERTELPVVENSQLFAQRAHSARYAPYHCPDSRPLPVSQRIPMRHTRPILYSQQHEACQCE